MTSVPPTPPETPPAPEPQPQVVQPAAAPEAPKEPNLMRTIISVTMALALVIAAVWMIFFRDKDDNGGGSGNYTAQATLNQDAGYVEVGNPDAKVTVDVYLDYHCSYCALFEEANSADLTTFVNDGNVKLQIHPLSFLDRASGDARYSTRAANSAVAVAADSPEAFFAFHNLLLEHQPTEAGGALTDDEIAALAKEAGAAQATIDTFADLKYDSWLSDITEAAFSGDDAIQGTPTAKINGTAFSGDIYNAGPLADAIKQAIG